MKDAMSAVAAAIILNAVSASAAFGQSCAQTAGRARAAEYVSQCRDVSPATRPPCNAANSCDLIISEIRRGCGFLSGADRPTYCNRYR